MKKAIISFINRIKSMGKIKGILYATILFFVGLTTFSIFSFSGRPFFNEINNLIHAVLILLIFIYILIYGSFRFDIFFILLALFNITVLISSVLSGFVNFRITTVILSVVAFFLYQFLICENNRQDTVRAILAGSLGFILYFIAVYFVPIFTLDFSTRLGFYFDDVNYVGRYFLFIYIFFLFYVLFQKNYRLIPIAVIALFLMVTTGSMSNLFSSVLITIILFLFFIPKEKRYILVISIFSLMIIGFLLLQLDALDYYRERIYGILGSVLNISTLNSDGSTEYRSILLTEAFYMFLKKPLFGYGFYSVASYSLTGQFSHNNIMDLLANHGIFATLLFEYLILAPIAKMSQKVEKNRALYIALGIYIFIYQMFLVTYYHKFEYFVFALLYAYVYEEKDKHFSFSMKIHPEVKLENTFLIKEKLNHAKNP